MAHFDCGWTCGRAGKKLKSLENTRAVPERFCGGVSLRRGAISSVSCLWPGLYLHKAQAKDSLWLYWFIVLFRCFIAWYLCSPRPYVIHFLLLWHDSAYLCWKCRKTPTN